MNLLIVKKNKFFNFIENIKSENLGFYLSSLFHFFILIFVIGLPNFFVPKPINVPTIIPIEIINISDVTTIPKEVKEAKTADVKKVKVKEKKFNSSDNQEIKKIETKEASKIKNNETKIINSIETKETPKIKNNETKIISSKENIIIKEKKETLIKLDKEDVRIDTNKIESLPTKKIKPKLKPKPSQTVQKLEAKLDVITKIEPKPKPKLKIIETKSDVVTKTEPKPKKNIVASVLKDLRNEDSSLKMKSESVKKKEEVINQTENNVSKENAQLSISEIDLLRQQLSSCWIAPAGTVIKKGMFVKIKAKITRARKVENNVVHIHDTNIAENNPFYKSITESAMRTLLNPKCSPLKLPEDKYESWKELTITLDYVLMGG